MTRRHEIEEHLLSLQDISKIMGSMKNLSLMETRKLARFFSSQQRVVQSIQTAGADFLYAYPEFSVPPETACAVFIIIGSERGFCGDFNEKLLVVLHHHLQQKPVQNPKLVAIGSRLFSSLEDNPLVAGMVGGPTVGQEVDAVLSRLVDRLTEISHEYGPLSVTVLYHEHEKESIQMTPLLPPFQHLKAKRYRYAYPPHLTVSKEKFFEALVEHYLFAALHEMFYSSLMAEHHRRVQHLEGAIDRLEEKAADLGKKRDILRQEEITEEIEVIMLSAGLLDKF